MANITIRFGILLIALGIATFVPHHAPTALIPAYFGLALLIFGSLARTEDAKKRMLWMHIAVTVGLLGLIGALARCLMPAIHWMQGVVPAYPLATKSQLVLALVCLIYVILCVRSFIAARRARVI